MKYIILAYIHAQHNGAPYWRPDAAGYTESVADAGLYTQEQAEGHVAGTHGDHVVHALDSPELDAYLRNWSLVRRSELKLFRRLRELEASGLLANLYSVG